MPVKNQIIPLTIDTLTNGGFGIGRYEGMAVFVPYSAVGDVLTVKILKVKKSYCYAKIHSIETPSPDRIENDCPVFGRCGGCDFRHISYEAEIRAKEQFIKDAFGQFSVLNPAFLPLLPFESPYRYRNKSQYPVGKNKEGQLHYGYYQANSHRIVPCDDCLLLPKDIVEIASFVAEFARNNGISPYDEAAHKGVLRHIFVRKGHYSGETNVCIVARRKVPEFYPLAKRLMQKFPSVKGVVLNINPEKTNVILGEKELLLSGKPTITDTLCGFSVEISPKSFYQVNTPAAETLYKTAMQFLKPKEKTVLDLYCGAGTISMLAAKDAKEVIGVEIVPEAVENAIKNAKSNHISNISFVCADAGDYAKQVLETGKKIDAVLIDPPRKGCSKETLDAIAKIAPNDIVMISCNPATAARDCALLHDLGYRTKTVQGVDLFSRTGHVECVVLMTNVKNR